MSKFELKNSIFISRLWIIENNLLKFRKIKENYNIQRFPIKTPVLFIMQYENEWFVNYNQRKY